MFDASWFLWASLFALLLGPLVYELAVHRRRILPALDGFVIGTVGALVLFGILPEATATAGWMAVAAAALGFAALTLLERVTRISVQGIHGAFIALAFVALLVHVVLDGVAVHAPDDDVGFAVVVHRVPFAIGVWWLLKPRVGAVGAALALVLVAAATLAGFELGHGALSLLEGPKVAVFQAGMGGALLHVLGHRTGHRTAHPRTERGLGLHLVETVALLVGAGLFALSLHDEERSPLLTYAARFWDYCVEAAPALLLGYALAGVLVVLLPKASSGWLQGRTPFGSALRGTAFGLPLPICSCGVIPLYQGLVTRGAPPAAAIAFLIATPELGIEAVLLSFPLLGPELAVARVVAAVAVALGVALVLGSALPGRAPGPAEAAHDVAHRSWPAKILAALRHGFVEVLDDTAAWIVAGIAVAAAIDASSLHGILAQLPAGSDIVLAALLGAPLYVCASGATPLAAALLVAGLSPGAVLTFLLAGPATNVTTLGTLAQLHSRKTAAAFAGLVTAGAIALGFLTNAVLPEAGPTVARAGHLHESGSLLGVASAVLFLAGVLFSVLRRGPSGFLHPVLHLGGHDHGHGHGHDHHHHDHDHHHHDHHDHDHHDHDHDPPPPVAPDRGCCS